MIAKAAAVLVAAICLLVPALAEDAAPQGGGARFVFNKVADGFLRLDTQTGEVSLCSRHAVGWACEAAPEDRAVLENEIERLRRENAALKKDILSRGLPLPPGAMPLPPAAREEDHVPSLSGNTNIDRMVALVGRVWHRLVDAIAQAQRDIMKKS